MNLPTKHTDARPALIKARLPQGLDGINGVAGIFPQKTVLVVSAGPSCQYWESVLEQLGEGTPTACIKQAATLVGPKCNLLFVNPYNHQKYRKIRKDCSVFFCDVEHAPKVFGPKDIVFRIQKSTNGLPDCLACKRDFDQWTLAASGLHRPWGPGIMHEVVLYTMFHMGFEKVVTIGWDVADEKGKNTHFYDQKKSAQAWGTVKRKANSFIQKNAVLRTPFFFFKHHLGYRYNRPAVVAGEFEAVASSLPEFLSWFDRQGMRIHMISDSRWVLDNCGAYASPTSDISRVCESLRNGPIPFGANF